MCSKGKIKICFVISSLANSGPVNVLLNTVKFLDKSQFDIHIITLFEESKYSRLDDFKKLKIIISQSTLPKKKKLAAYLRLRSSLKKMKPIVVHSHCVLSLGYLMRIHGTFEKVHTIHMHPMQFFILKYGKMKGWLMTNLYSQGYRKMNKVIVCANHLEKKIERGGRIKTTAIRNGVDTTLFNKVSLEKKEELKRKAGYEDKVIYLMNNRLSPEKNNAFVLRNFPKEGNAQLIILGDGKDEEGIALNSKEKPNVSWVRYTDKVFQYLQMSDYYISASKTEGLPMAVLEAMSCGVSPILSDTPSHRELVSSLENALIFSLESNEELRSIFKNTSNLTTQFSSQIRNHVKGDFSAESMASLHGKVYETLSAQK